MNTIATRFQIGTAALAVAAAATLVPAAAQAAPSISAPTAPMSHVLDNLSLGPASLAEANWWDFFPGLPSLPGLPGLGSTPGINSSSVPSGLTLLNIDIPFITPGIIKPLVNALGLGNLTICLGIAGAHIDGYTGVIRVSVFGC
jgi:hypothetical protein